MKIYSEEETPLLDGTKYIVQQVEKQQIEKAVELLSQGFEFHERYLLVENNLKSEENLCEQTNEILKGVCMEIEHDYREDLYSLAYESFEADRRFHLERKFDQEIARYVKESYINQCRDSGMPFFSVRKDGKLLGYIIIELQPQKAGGCIHIMLGVTCPGIKGKMIAPLLYKGMLMRFSLTENGGYTKYRGYISSANIASINLHQGLGAKIIKVVDEYIYRTSGGGGEHGAYRSAG